MQAEITLTYLCVLGIVVGVVYLIRDQRRRDKDDR